MGLLLLVLVAAATPTLQAAPEQDQQADARILIDISGSMRKNDPKNLRRPALRMLVGLLPADARAGVWTFGQYVNMLIPLGQVDEAWKRKARAEAENISSPGQFTNIEDVIRRSMADWDGPETRYRRHLVLLTDGMVDISKSEQKNSASRQRILQELLPRLKAHDAQVHTIALSSRADHELLQQLSRETDGWYEQVDNAEQLQRIFLRIFEKVGQPDTLPLKDNRFMVDSSIQEVTLLVFRKEDAEATRVVTPSGQEFDAKSAPASVNWHRDVGYDMLTISKPETGEWRVLAAMDPDNRVIVVTDLQMRSSTLPTRFVLGESLPMTVSFSNQGKLITRQDFLDVVDLKAGHRDANGEGERRPLYDAGEDGDEAAGDGLFTFMVGEGLAAGTVELVITAQGKTFQREQRHTFELAEPLAMSLVPEQGGGDLLLRLSPDSEVVETESVQVSAVLRSAEGEERPLMLLPGGEDGNLEARIQPSELLGDWSLEVSVKGTSVAGSPLELTLDPVTVEGTASPPPPPEPEPEPVVEEAPAEPAANPEPEPVAEPETENGDEFMFQMALLGGINLLLLLIGGAVFWWLRRSRRSEEFRVLEEGEPVPGEGDSA
ncbi:MAG: VWA domain-containing protein [Sedimenticola sp.]|nr:VWA domain-containing protein [Sedimenticola sp.]